MDIRNMVVGDPTMSVKELWGAELQENDAMLIREKDRAFLEAVGERENVPVMVMGKITDTGRMVVKDSKTGETAVDLDLELVLGELPKKTFVDHHVPAVLKPLVLPEQLTVMQALDRVLRLLSVGSKRFLWLLWLLWLVRSKVDRWVRGLMARQQCCTCRRATWRCSRRARSRRRAARRRWASQLEIVELKCCEAMGDGDGGGGHGGKDSL